MTMILTYNPTIKNYSSITKIEFWVASLEETFNDIKILMENGVMVDNIWKYQKSIREAYWNVRYRDDRDWLRIQVMRTFPRWYSRFIKIIQDNPNWKKKIGG